MTGFKSARTAGLETDLAQARRALRVEGERSPDGSDAYTRAAQAVQDIHHQLHLSYANDRERH
ncbi:hypothetical protein [Actinomadura luteofluorescens]|uniref:hypothetical protein n=1 Tax=Actinomadura luteofluorescens TaxID=46163 RepID=UPI003D90B327